MWPCVSRCWRKATSYLFEFVDITFHSVKFRHVAQVFPGGPLVFANQVVESRLGSVVRPFRGLLVESIKPQPQLIWWLKWSWGEERVNWWPGWSINKDVNAICNLPSLEGVAGKLRITLTAASNCLLTSIVDTQSSPTACPFCAWSTRFMVLGVNCCADEVDIMARLKWNCATQSGGSGHRRSNHGWSQGWSKTCFNQVIESHACSTSPGPQLHKTNMLKATGSNCDHWTCIGHELRSQCNSILTQILTRKQWGKLPLRSTVWHFSQQLLFNLLPNTKTKVLRLICFFASLHL